MYHYVRLSFDKKRCVPFRICDKKVNNNTEVFSMVSWFLKMFLKILKPFGKIGFMLVIIKAIEDMLKGENGGNEDNTDPAVPEA